MTVLWLALWGCGPCVVSWTPAASVLDECDGLCWSASLGGSCEQPLALRSDVDGLLETVSGEENCFDGHLTPGVHALTLGDGETYEVTVRPFGYAQGLDRGEATPDTTPPTLTGLPADPVFVPGTGFDAASVLAPTVMHTQGVQWLAYAGTSDGGAWGDYRLGLASRALDSDEDYSRDEEPALALIGAWDAYGQNTPEWAYDGHHWWLYFNGRGAEDGELSIGRARFVDGVLEPATEPVLTASGEPGTFDHRTVAHPSVVHTDGIVELWYAGGGLEIGYALSEDGGESFTRYCDNPVFSGVGTDSWDAGQVKAPEVRRDADGGYVMSYSGCGRGCYEVGWAVSPDGLHWQAAEAPWLTAGEAGDWTSQAVQEAFLQASDTGLTLWFAGTDGSSTAIGTAGTR